MIHLYTYWRHQKTKGFLMFWGDTEMEVWVKWVNEMTVETQFLYLLSLFNAWCPLKGHTYLNKTAAKPVAESYRFA